MGEDGDDGEMLGEATLLRMACVTLDDVFSVSREHGGENPYEIVVNDVRNLRCVLVDCVGVPEDRWKVMSGVVDKLDKYAFDELVPEFLRVHPECDVERLRHFLTDEETVCTPQDSDSQEDWKALLRVAGHWGFRDRLRFSGCLSRGLDYYSGFVWEARCLYKNREVSVAAGGRYDALMDRPLVGMSFGVTRIVSCLSSSTTTELDEGTKWRNGACYVTVLGPGVAKEDVLDVIAWSRVNWPEDEVTYSLKACTEGGKKRLKRVIEDCVRAGTPRLVVVAEREWKERRNVLVKDLRTVQQEEVHVPWPPRNT